jgi:hypothetical protein
MFCSHCWRACRGQLPGPEFARSATLLIRTMWARERTALVICGLAIGGLVSACASMTGRSIRQLEGGRFQLECETSLRDCLELAETRCDISGYQVLDAAEAKRRVGVSPLQSEYRDSRATFVCGANQAALELTPARAAPPPPPATAAHDTCLPGASQACVGPGGCSGGQSCLPDGRSLSPCDCGPPTPAQPQHSATAPQ